MKVVVLGALLGALAVGLGAFNAHILGGRLAADPDAFGVAVNYQLFHALALIAIGAVRRDLPPFLFATASWAIGLGIVVFCGGIYLISLGGPEWLATATPVGGGALIFGWLMLAIGAAQRIGKT